MIMYCCVAVEGGRGADRGQGGTTASSTRAVVQWEDHTGKLLPPRTITTNTGSTDPAPGNLSVHTGFTFMMALEDAYAHDPTYAQRTSSGVYNLTINGVRWGWDPSGRRLGRPPSRGIKAKGAPCRLG
jgi:hypothetical protein